MNNIRTRSRVIASVLLVCILTMFAHIAYADLSGPGAPPPPPPGSKG